MENNISENTTLQEIDISSKNNPFNNFKNLLSRFNTEDIILFGLLFILIEEGIDDEFLILIIVFLILTE